uniref:Uncharacterized protein n=1 Tax=Astyanax mexicanus TaxID=7994 RepID=A0A8B9GRW6_ASTMX
MHIVQLLTTQMRQKSILVILAPTSFYQQSLQLHSIALYLGSWLGQLSSAHSLLLTLLFSIYTTPLGQVICSHGFSYLSFSPEDPPIFAWISQCLSAWMKEHHLQLNLSKTELGNIHQHNFTITIDSPSLSPTKAARHLGLNQSICPPCLMPGEGLWGIEHLSNEL